MAEALTALYPERRVEDPRLPARRATGLPFPIKIIRSGLGGWAEAPWEFVDSALELPVVGP